MYSLFFPYKFSIFLETTMNEYGSERLWIYESRIWTADKYGSVTKQTPPQRLFFFFLKITEQGPGF